MASGTSGAEAASMGRTGRPTCMVKVASASTRLGGWLNGALYGALVVLFATGWQGAAPMHVAVSAALLASLAAPLLDETAIALWTARRRKRHG